MSICVDKRKSADMDIQLDNEHMVENDIAFSHFSDHSIDLCGSKIARLIIKILLLNHKDLKY